MVEEGSFRTTSLVLGGRQPAAKFPTKLDKMTAWEPVANTNFANRQSSHLCCLDVAISQHLDCFA